MTILLSWGLRLLGIIGIPPWLAVLFALGGSMGGAYLYGHHQAAQACQEASLRTENETLKRDFAAWKAADQVEAILNKDIEADRQKLEQQVKDYEVQLRTRPAKPDCSLSDDDIGALGGVSGKRKRKGTGG